MNETKRIDEQPADGSGQNALLKKIGIYGAVLLAVFLIGFVPMWLTARDRANDLAESRRQLKAVQIQHTLASAAIDARRGEYETARQSASDFFTNLGAETGLTENSLLTPAQIDGAKPLLAQRDEIITLLARSDPASADRLSGIYVEYRKLIIGL